MSMYLLTALAALAGTAAAKQCINQTVPVTIESRNAVFDIPIPHTNLDVTTFIQNYTRQGGNFTDMALTGYATVSNTYNISTQFCRPDHDNSTNPTVQILTHGIGFDKTYWDLSFNDFNYSYVNVATDQYKYCTLSYDRLGIANSSHGEPLNEIQSFLEVQALRALTEMLRNGTFPGVKHTFDTTIHVGHSFGSAQTYAFSSMYPDLTDGIVLTGISNSASFISLFAASANFMTASNNQPFRFGSFSGMMLNDLFNTYFPTTQFADLLAGLPIASIPAGQGLPDGYLIINNIEAIQYLLFFPGYFDPAILVAVETNKQPVTLGELLTLGSTPKTSSFAGPVLVLTGAQDLPFCGGDCLATGDPTLASIPASVVESFPNVAPANFTAYIQPNTGHALNTAYNQTGTYNVINTFLGEKGLASF